MGKRERQRARERKGELPSATPAALGEVHVTVAVIGGLDQLDLTHETRLVKAALLYADHVTLASPKAVLLANLATYSSRSPSDRIDATLEMMRGLDDGRRVVEFYEQLHRRRGRLSPQERLQMQQLEEMLAENGDDIAAKMAEVLQEAGAQELANAMAGGVVDIDSLGSEHADADSYTDTVIGGMTALLRNSVSGSTRSFPLFDDGAGDLLRTMVKEGKLADPHLPPAAAAGIAGRLIGELPAFPAADMDVVLDVRQKLQVPLVRFRAALAKASTEFESAAWDETFAREVDDLYAREVAPALLEVKESLDELGALPTLLRLAAGKEAMASVTATMALAAATGIAHVDLPALLYGASPAAGGIAAAAGEALQRRNTRRGVERNAFYFLYESKRLLAD